MRKDLFTCAKVEKRENNLGTKFRHKKKIVEGRLLIQSKFLSKRFLVYCQGNIPKVTLDFNETTEAHHYASSGLKVRTDSLLD